MVAPATFVCDCGVRLQVFAEGKDANTLSCPNPNCKTCHLVSGQIRDVQIERGGYLHNLPDVSLWNVAVLIDYPAQSVSRLTCFHSSRLLSSI